MEARVTLVLVTVCGCPSLQECRRRIRIKDGIISVLITSLLYQSLADTERGKWR